MARLELPRTPVGKPQVLFLLSIQGVLIALILHAMLHKLELVVEVI